MNNDVKLIIKDDSTYLTVSDFKKIHNWFSKTLLSSQTYGLNKYLKSDNTYCVDILDVFGEKLYTLDLHRWTDHPDEDEALEWWEKLPMKTKHNETYHYCTGCEISTMEFNCEDIIEIWTQKTQK